MNRCINGLEMTLCCLEHCPPVNIPNSVLTNIELSSMPECRLWRILTVLLFNNTTCRTNEINKVLLERELLNREPRINFDGWASLPLDMELHAMGRG